MGHHKEYLCLLLLLTQHVYARQNSRQALLKRTYDIVDHRITQADLRYNLALDTKRNANLEWDINPASQTITFRQVLTLYNFGNLQTTPRPMQSTATIKEKDFYYVFYK